MDNTRHSLDLILRKNFLFLVLPILFHFTQSQGKSDHLIHYSTYVLYGEGVATSLLVESVPGTYPNISLKAFRLIYNIFKHFPIINRYQDRTELFMITRRMIARILP